eukprot:GHVP01007654.1.p1 GENE.GHVP01007654.1~~GHVP01007654.1.p1  ORF type:complete len:159 (-),score=21.33 GHVP01007654.1:1-408(-)
MSHDIPKIPFVPHSTATTIPVKTPVNSSPFSFSFKSKNYHSQVKSKSTAKAIPVNPLRPQSTATTTPVKIWNATYLLNSFHPSPIRRTPNRPKRRISGDLEGGLSDEELSSQSTANPQRKGFTGKPPLKQTHPPK